MRFLEVLVAGHVEKLPALLFSHFESVAAALEFAAEGLDKAALFIKHKNRGMLRLVDPPFVDYVEPILTVHRDIVSRLPGVGSGRHDPVVEDLIPMFPFPDDHPVCGGGDRLAWGEQVETAEACGARR